MDSQERNGRRLVLQALDTVLSQENNIRTFAGKFQEAIDTDALNVFKTIVMPLLPKQIELSGEVKEYKDLPEGTDDLVPAGRE